MCVGVGAILNSGTDFVLKGSCDVCMGEHSV